MKSPHPILMIAVWLAVVAFAGVILYQNLELRSESARLQYEVDNQSILKLSEEIQFANRFTPAAASPARAAESDPIASPQIKAPMVRQTAPRRGGNRSSAPSVEEVFENVPDIEAAQRNFGGSDDIALYDPRRFEKKPAKSNPPSITVRPPQTPAEPFAPEPSVGTIGRFTDGGGVFGTSERTATGSDISIAGCRVIDINKAGDGTLGINRGTDAGINNGMKLFIVRDEKPVGMIEIVNAGPYISVGEIIEGEQRINVNDRCILGK